MSHQMNPVPSSPGRAMLAKKGVEEKQAYGLLATTSTKPPDESTRLFHQIFSEHLVWARYHLDLESK